MARYALVIGIARYNSFRDLPKAAVDAEAVAQTLEQHGDFYKVDRLPRRWVAGQNHYEVAEDKHVTADELFNTIKTLLQEAEKHEVLIYFAGHGFRITSRAGKQRGFLASSDSIPSGLNAIALDDDFNTLLEQANLSSLVVLLDCCHAGALLEADLTRQVIEPSLSSFNTPRDFYLMTACRSGEQAYEGEIHGVFTAAVLEGLSPSNANPETGQVSVNRLFDFVYQKLRGSRQEPFQLGGGRSLTLVTYSPQRKIIPEVDESALPYRGLQPFEKEQAKFFFGRKRVVEDIWKALERGNFVSVIGTSGSGKSSAVRAGLIPWLEETGWQVLGPIKPGITPLAKLAAIFEPLFESNRSQKLLNELIHLQPEGLRKLAELLPGSAKFLLVVDQFEEVFTLARTNEKKQFIDLLTQVAIVPHPRLAVVMTMRADFLEPCLEHSNLTRLIQEQPILMPNLVGADLEQAIAEPAKRLGYSFEPGLLGEILHEVGQEPGCLPLLQFALLELWNRRNRQSQQLTRSAYKEMGGVFGALNCYAEQIYKEFTSSEKIWVERLCLKLVRTGMELRDTRQRQLKNDLLGIAGNDIDDQQDCIRVLEELVDRRFLVTGDDEGKVWIDLAHEALMVAWKRFEEWRQNNRELRQLIDRINDAYREWQIHQQSDRFLLPQWLLFQAQNHTKDIEQYLPSAREFYERSYAHEKLRDMAVGWVQIEPLLRRESLNWLQNLSEVQSFEKLVSAIQLAGLNLTKGMGDMLAPVQEVLYQAVKIARECNCLEGFATSICSISFSPNGQFIVGGSEDGVIAIWDLSKKQPFVSFKGHQNFITSVSFDPTGQLIASSSYDCTIRLWDIYGNPIGSPFLGHSGPVNSVVFSPDGQLIVSCGAADCTIRLWDIYGNPIGSPFLGHSGPVNSVAFSPDGQLIVSGSSDATLCLWDLVGNVVFVSSKKHEGRIHSVAFSPNGQLIVSGSSDATLCLWNLKGDLVCPPFRGHKDQVNSVCFSSSGNLIISGSDDHSIRLWDLKGNLVDAPFHGHRGSILSVISSSCERYIVSSSDDRTIRFWDIESDLINLPLQKHTAEVWSVAISPTGKTVASSGADRTIRLWDLEGDLVVPPLQGHEGSVNSVVFSPDGQYLASGSDDRTVRLWSLSGESIGAPFTGHQDCIWSVAINPQGKMIASSGADRTIRLWDLEGDLVVPPLQGHEGSVNSVDGQYLASGSDDGTVRLWSLSGEPIGAPLRGHTSWIRAIAFSADGKMIVSGSADKTLRLWNLEEKTCSVFVEEREILVSSVAFSPDNQMIASGSADGSLHLWNLKGDLVGNLQVHQTPILAIAFSLDSQFILTGGFDKTVRCCQSANWKRWLQICCNRLRSHSGVQDIQSDGEKIAYETCRKYVWSQ